MYNSLGRFPQGILRNTLNHRELGATAYKVFRKVSPKIR